jgi:hypothetical protein
MQNAARSSGTWVFSTGFPEHILEGSTFPNKYNLKNRKRTPVTCSVTENGRFQEICTLSFLLIDGSHNFNSLTKTAAKVRTPDPASYSRLAERILIKL